MLLLLGKNIPEYNIKIIDTINPDNIQIIFKNLSHIFYDYKHIVQKMDYMSLYELLNKSLCNEKFRSSYQNPKNGGSGEENPYYDDNELNGINPPTQDCINRIFIFYGNTLYELNLNIKKFLSENYFTLNKIKKFFECTLFNSNYLFINLNDYLNLNQFKILIKRFFKKRLNIVSYNFRFIEVISQSGGKKNYKELNRKIRIDENKKHYFTFRKTKYYITGKTKNKKIGDYLIHLSY
jgi:hypothetical protein